MRSARITPAELAAFKAHLVVTGPLDADADASYKAEHVRRDWQNILETDGGIVVAEGAFDATLVAAMQALVDSRAKRVRYDAS